MDTVDKHGIGHDYQGGTVIHSWGIGSNCLGMQRNRLPICGSYSSSVHRHSQSIHMFSRSLFTGRIRSCLTFIHNVFHVFTGFYRFFHKIIHNIVFADLNGSLRTIHPFRQIAPFWQGEAELSLQHAFDAF